MIIATSIELRIGEVFNPKGVGIITHFGSRSDQPFYVIREATEMEWIAYCKSGGADAIDIATNLVFAGMFGHYRYYEIHVD